MEKLKYIKIEKEDGTLSNNVPIGVDSENVDTANGTSNLTNDLNSINTNLSRINNTLITHGNSITNVNDKTNVLQNEINSLAGGAPLVASSVTEMTNTSKIYVNTTDGHWYYYNGSTWTDGGVYQAVQLDKNSVSAFNISDVERINFVSDISIKDFHYLGGYINGQTGVVTPGTSSTGLNSYNDYIMIKESSTYIHVFPNGINNNLCFYDENYTFINSAGATGIDRNTAIPNGAKYYRQSYALQTLDDIYKIIVYQDDKSTGGSSFNKELKMRNKYTIGGLPKTITDGYIEWHWDTNECFIKECKYIHLVFDKYILQIFNSNTASDFSFSWSTYGLNYIYWDFSLKSFGCIINPYNQEWRGVSAANRVFVGTVVADGTVGTSISAANWDVYIHSRKKRQYDAGYLRGTNTTYPLTIKSWQINNLDKSIDIVFSQDMQWYGIMYVDTHYTNGHTLIGSTQSFHIPSSNGLFINKLTNEIITSNITAITSTSTVYELIVVNVDGILVAGKGLANIHSMMINYLKEKIDNVHIPSGTEKSYTGEKISLVPKLHYQQTSLVVNGLQDAATYNDKCFALGSDCLVKVYDLQNNYTLLQSFYLDQYQTIAPHNNTCFFGTEKYDSNDIYPLFYTNAYNNTALPRGTFYAYRFITNENGTIVENALVQTISIGFTNDEIWISQPNENRPYGNFIMDRDRHKLYAYLPRQKEPCMRFFKFEMPTLADGANITLNKTDILSQFDTPFHSIIQGTEYYNDKIFVTTGLVDNDNYVVVIDVKSEKEIANIDCNQFWVESEGIFAYDNKLYVASNRFYIFDFD